MEVENRNRKKTKLKTTKNLNIRFRADGAGEVYIRPVYRSMMKTNQIYTNIALYYIILLDC